jgi:hypothetical protein
VNDTSLLVTLCRMVERLGRPVRSPFDVSALVAAGLLQQDGDGVLPTRAGWKAYYEATGVFA